MSFLNETQRFQLGTLLKGAALSLKLGNIPHWWGQSAQTSEQAANLFRDNHSEFDLGVLFAQGLGTPPTQEEKNSLLYRAIYLQSAASEIQTHLQEKNIRFAFVKGISQDAKYWHKNPARPFADVDLWIHPEDTTACQSVVNALGYKMISPSSDPHLPIECHKEINGNVLSLDIHSLPFDGFRITHSWDNVWDDVKTANTCVGPRNLLAPEDEIIFWTGNQLKTLFGAWPKACLDIYVIISNENIDWDSLEKKSKAAHLQWPLWGLLFALNNADVMIPPQTLQRLAPPFGIKRKIKRLFAEPNSFHRAERTYLHRIFWVLMLSGDFLSALNYVFWWVPRRIYLSGTDFTKRRAGLGSANTSNLKR